METDQERTTTKPRQHANPMTTQAVIYANWTRLTARGPKKTLSLLSRKFPQFKLYRCTGPGFRSPSQIVVARGSIGSVIIEPYMPEANTAAVAPTTQQPAMI